jgi:glycerol-3-phosphate acyltransferase PlsX
MRIGIDAMGSDAAPLQEVKGALACREFLAPDDQIVLVGDEELLRKHLDGEGDGWQDLVEIQHAGKVIGMNEPPVEALRAKPDSSVATLVKMHKEGGVDACISAGNTGAYVAASQMLLRRLPGVHRPGITILTPTYNGLVAICDVGANVNCRPQHLHQYGVMASVYLNAIGGIRDPRVGLLSVGEEDRKGNELVKRTHELMRNDPNLNFIGNVEGRDLFTGVCDVVVSDGFVGNVVLKLMEGMAEGVLTAMLKELATAMPDMAGKVQKAGGDIVAKYDYNEYGGAPLLGVSGICIICHGASDHRGIKNAVRGAMDLSKRHVNETIVKLLAQTESLSE